MTDMECMKRWEDLMDILTQMKQTDRDAYKGLKKLTWRRIK